MQNHRGGRSSAMHADGGGNQQSAFTALSAPGGLPEINLFSQLAPFYQGQGSTLTPQQLQQYLALQAAQAQSLQMQEASRSAPAPAKAESKANSAYASRHQAAEQRRRNRINQRLDKLRTLVPHAERANTASFLEEVIKYIEELQSLLKCGPNYQTGAPATHPGAHLASQRAQQPLDLSSLSGSAATVMPGTYSGGPAYGVATPSGGFEILQQVHAPQHLANMMAMQHPGLAAQQPTLPQQTAPQALPAGVRPMTLQGFFPPDMQLQLQHPAVTAALDHAAAVAAAAGTQNPPAGSVSDNKSAAAVAGASGKPNGNLPAMTATGAGADATSPASGSEDASEGRPLKKRQRSSPRAAAT